MNFYNIWTLYFYVFNDNLLRKIFLIPHKDNLNQYHQQKYALNIRRPISVNHNIYETYTIPP